ncbi:MAG: peptide deformylase [Verrucomicrobiaceae bacterium]|jgi:peptide deformylase|nr:peptide deformylase [Verrucomicrobiaceae bacterium]
MVRRVTKYGEDVLKQVVAPVENFDASIKELADDMVETMYEANGLGLAAPQVNESLAMFVIDMRRRLNTDAPCEFTIDGKTLPLDIAMPLVAINPKLDLIGEYVEVCEEGCLSFPGIFAEVERVDVVKLNYQDVNGIEHELICNDLFARCVQHEFDHLQGICFVNRVEKKNISKIETKLKKLRRETRDFLKSQKNK